MKRLKRFGIISESYVSTSSSSAPVEQEAADNRIYFNREDFSQGTGIIERVFALGDDAFTTHLDTINQRIYQLFDMNAPLTPTETAVKMLQDIEPTGGGGGISVFNDISTAVSATESLGEYGDITFSPHAPTLFRVTKAHINVLTGVMDTFGESPAAEAFEMYIFPSQQEKDRFGILDHLIFNKLQPAFTEDEYGYFDPTLHAPIVSYKMEDGTYTTFWIMRSRTNMADGRIHYVNRTVERTGANEATVVVNSVSYFKGINLESSLKEEADALYQASTVEYLPNFREGQQDHYLTLFYSRGLGGQNRGHKKAIIVTTFEAYGYDYDTGLSTQFERTNTVDVALLNDGETDMYLSGIYVPVFPLANKLPEAGIPI